LEYLGEAEENIDEEKEKSLKTGYITLYTNFLWARSQDIKNNQKIE
jgi:hypothetical protein